MSLAWTLYCDGRGPIFADKGCPKQIEAAVGLPAHQLRHMARIVGGWKRLPKGRDLCADCARRGKEAGE